MDVIHNMVSTQGKTWQEQLAFVVSNIEQFATAWEVPFDELAYALATREATHAAQRSVQWVRDRLVRLATNYVDGYEFRVEAFEAEIPADELPIGTDFFCIINNTLRRIGITVNGRTMRPIHSR